MLPASVQVCPVEIPGRGRRQGENAIDSVTELADLLVETLPLQVSIQSRAQLCQSQTAQSGLHQPQTLLIYLIEKRI